MCEESTGETWIYETARVKQKEKRQDIGIYI